MRLWSLQPSCVADKLKSGANVHAHPDFEIHWGQRPGSTWGFKQAYDWMSQQMAQRVSEPPFFGATPMWAWARPPFATRSGAPDMRAMRHGEPGVLLELDVDPCTFLSSDSCSWHHVLNGWILSASAQEDREIHQKIKELCQKLVLPLTNRGLFDAKHYLIPEIMAILGQTWTRIFCIKELIPGVPARLDLGGAADPDWLGGAIDVQACLWSIEPSHVVSAKPYQARTARSLATAARSTYES